MISITYKDREFTVPEGFEYHVGIEDGVKYLLIPINKAVEHDDHLFAFTVDQGVLLVCDISVDQGLALAFPGINESDLKDSEVILLSEDKSQYYCRDFGYEW